MRTLRRCTLYTIILAQLALAPGLALAQQQTPPAAPQEEPSPADVGDADTDEVAPEELGADPDTRTLETVVVSGEIQFRNRTATVAPVLVFDRQVFQKFEPVSVGDQLRRVPGVVRVTPLVEGQALATAAGASPGVLVRGVRPTEAERVRQHGAHVLFHGLVGREIDGRVERRIIEVQRRRNHAIADRQYAEDRLHRTSRAEQQPSQ